MTAILRNKVQTRSKSPNAQISVKLTHAYFRGVSLTGIMNISFKGLVTCHGNMVKNANCPKDQYMVVKTASYRGLSDSKTCGLSDDYSCEVDVTCLVKKQCDGQHECNITVDNNLFSDDPCPGLTKYLYFEYQCITGVTAFNEPCGKWRLICYGTIVNIHTIEVFEPTKCIFLFLQ